MGAMAMAKLPGLVCPMVTASRAVRGRVAYLGNCRQPHPGPIGGQRTKPNPRPQTTRADTFWGVMYQEWSEFCILVQQGYPERCRANRAQLRSLTSGAEATC